jgi:hypothetical protein
MMGSLKIHIIYCITLVAVIIYRLRLCVANLSINESMNESVSTCNVDNSYASDKLDVIRLFGSRYFVKMQFSVKIVALTLK